MPGCQTREENAAEMAREEAEQEAENSSPPQSTSDIITLMREVRDERRLIAEREKELVAEWKSLELELLTRFDEQGQDLGRVPGVGTASITTNTVPQVVDWDEFYRYMKDEDALYLLQRRVATSAWNELLKSGVEVPGINPYEKRNISLRNDTGK